MLSCVVVVRRALLHEASGGVGNTALHWAAAKGHAGCVRLLLQAGAPLEQLNAAGGSALHSSAVRFLNIAPTFFHRLVNKRSR